MNEQATGDGAGIQDAIASYLVAETGMDIHPMVGNFTLICEIIDPDSGQLNLAAIQTVDLPAWVEYGMLGLRINEVAQGWNEAGLADYIGNIEEGE